MNNQDAFIIVPVSSDNSSSKGFDVDAGDLPPIIVPHVKLELPT